MIFVHSPTVQNLKNCLCSSAQMPQDDANQEATEESRKPWKVESIVDFYVFRTEKNMRISYDWKLPGSIQRCHFGDSGAIFSHRFSPCLNAVRLKVCDFHDFTQFTHGCEKCPKRIATPKYSATFKAHRFEGFTGLNSRSKSTNIHYEVAGILGKSGVGHPSWAYDALGSPEGLQGFPTPPKKRIERLRDIWNRYLFNQYYFVSKRDPIL